jgi:uncharacterized protein
MSAHVDDGPGTLTASLAERVRQILEENADGLPFHSWTHTEFVWSKATEFARERSADERLVGAAALVHDLNYVVEHDSTPDAARSLRNELLADHSFTAGEIARIEQIIRGAHTAWRQDRVDVETACLSDADTLYKALPITPVLYAHRYLAENDIPLVDLARKIISEQAEKLSSGYYFYDDEIARKYEPWAQANLALWRVLQESLGDPDVARLVKQEGH